LIEPDDLWPDPACEPENCLPLHIGLRGARDFATHSSDHFRRDFVGRVAKIEDADPRLGLKLDPYRSSGRACTRYRSVFPDGGPTLIGPTVKEPVVSTSPNRAPVPSVTVIAPS
jgi:hypothetical protein